jgi:hypothetical protein
MSFYKVGYSFVNKKSMPNTVKVIAALPNHYIQLFENKSKE